jgi:transcription termination factor Rho
MDPNQMVGPNGGMRNRRRRRPPLHRDRMDRGEFGANIHPQGDEPLDGHDAMMHDEGGMPPSPHDMAEGATHEPMSAPPEIPLTEFQGILEMHPNGYGFLRAAENNYSRERSDPFVPGTMIERFALRQGVKIRALVQPARRQQGPRVREVLDVDGMSPDQYPSVKPFDTQTPINPQEWLNLEIGQQPITNRVIDLLSPLGKGQRALIVAPPRSGKTIMLQNISKGVSTNHPDVHLIVLLIDERPEEVTDMRRNVLGGEVIASSLDMDVDSHVRLSQLVIERCKRLAEMGKDVFLLLDSITRLARAFNKWVGQSGRGRATMTGGLDIKAMDIPKKLFATARAFEHGGSLTIVGTALIDTNSRMDEAIFQEFKGTGNMELVLDRRLADRRVWPAIDISQSGTRREELLLDEKTLEAVTMLRRTLSSMHHVDAMEQLTKQLGRFPTNAEFIKLISGARMQD